MPRAGVPIIIGLRRCFSEAIGKIFAGLILNLFEEDNDEKK
jgi:hypothetical protein